MSLDKNLLKETRIFLCAISNQLVSVFRCSLKPLNHFCDNIANLKLASAVKGQSISKIGFYKYHISIVENYIDVLMKNASGWFVVLIPQIGWLLIL